MDDSRVCTSSSTVSPLSGKFRGQIYTAVSNFRFATGVSCVLTPVFAVCVFRSADFPPCCCPYPQISIWTGVGEEFSPVSHLCLFLGAGYDG